MNVTEWYEKEFKGKIVTFYGESGTLKSFTAFNIAKTIAPNGYLVLDTENSISQFTQTRVIRCINDFTTVINTIQKIKAKILVYDSIGATANTFFSRRARLGTKYQIEAARNVAINIQAVYSVILDKILKSDIESAIVINQPVSRLAILGKELNLDKIEDPRKMLGDKAVFYSKTQYFFQKVKEYRAGNERLTLARITSMRSDNFRDNTVIAIVKREGNLFDIKFRV